MDAEAQTKATTPLHITPEELERSEDFDKTLPVNGTNDVVEKQHNKYDDVTTEKLQLKDKFVDISELHEASNAISDNDVYTNIIDTDQQPSRNGSKFFY